jgi:tetratricopeptide (TPR) repeat protein
VVGPFPSPRPPERRAAESNGLHLSRRLGRRLNRTGRLLLAAATLAAPLCLGGVPVWVTWVCAPLAFAALGLALIGREHLKVPLFAFVPLGVAAFCALQLIPLPPSLLGFISPPSAELREFALVPLGLTQWRPISLDPTATWRELGKHLLYAAAFLAALQLSSGARGARPMLIGAIAACGAFVVSLAALHPLLGLDELYGVYKFVAQPRLFTSFGNVNHLAGFLILCGCLSVALAIECDDRSRRFAWLGVFGTCSAGVLLSLSRAGIAAYCAALFLFLVATVLTRRSRPAQEGQNVTTTALRWGAVALSAVAIGAFVLFDKLVERFKDTQTYGLKLQIWPVAAAAAGTFWRTGMGRGVFEVGFTRFTPDHLGKTYTHPENVVLQLATEMGVLATAGVLIAAAAALFLQLRSGKRTPLELAVAVAAVGVVLHNLFDFNLEYPGVALPLAVAFGVGAGDAEGLWSLKLARPLPVVAALAGLTAVALTLGSGQLRNDEATLLAAYKASATSIEVRSEAVRMIDAHPADYLSYALAGASYVEKKPVDPLQAIAFANRALFLFPRDFRSHQVAARALRRLGRKSQALLEYRLSYESAFSAPDVIEECSRFAQTKEELLSCVPAQTQHVAMLLRYAVNPQLAGDACITALTTVPVDKDTGAFAVQCAHLLIALKRMDDAIAVLDTAVLALGDTPELAIGRAEVLKEHGKSDEAIAALEKALEKSPAHYDITVALADSYLAVKRYEAARAIVVRTTAVTTDSERRATLKTIEGEIDQSVGELERAVRELRAAAQLQPTAKRHYAVAAALMQLHDYDDAWAEVRAGQRLDSPQGAASSEDIFKTTEHGYRQLEAVKRQP